VWQTTAKIDLSALAENIEHFHSRFPRKVKVLFAVKADGYGHGIEAVSRTAQQVGIDYLGVDTLEDGVKIRSADVTLPILLLAPILPAEMNAALRFDLIPSIGDIEFADQFAHAAGQMGREANVQVSVDTGMGRFGVAADRALPLFEHLSKLDGMNVEGVFSHLSFSEAETPEAMAHSLSQIERFELLLASLEDEGMLPPLRHIGNSAAAIQYPERVITTLFNMVRIGTLFYGYPEVKRSWTGAMKPIAMLTARVISLKDLSAGDCVGYDCTYRASGAGRIAVISIGYGAGLHADLSNCGRVWLRSRYAPIVGKICLDHTIIDVTDIPNVAVGDNVEVFGPHQPADQLAEIAGLSVCQVLVPALRSASVRSCE